MYMYMVACLGMSKKKQLTCWRFCIFCSLCKFNVFTCCYICVACKIIFPHKLYPFRSFISWCIKSHTSNFSFSPLNRVDVCREGFLNSKWICKGKQSIFTIITSCKSKIIKTCTCNSYTPNRYIVHWLRIKARCMIQNVSQALYLLWIIKQYSTVASR